MAEAREWFGGVSVLGPSPDGSRPAAEEPELPLLQEPEIRNVIRRYLAGQPGAKRAAALECLQRLLEAEAEKLRPAGPYPDSETYRPFFVYFIQHPATRLVKIGRSRGDPYQRMRQLQIGAAGELTMLGYIRSSESLERRLHEHFAAAREFGEWFSPVPELLAYIEHYSEL